MSCRYYTTSKSICACTDLIAILFCSSLHKVALSGTFCNIVMIGNLASQALYNSQICLPLYYSSITEFILQFGTEIDIWNNVVIAHIRTGFLIFRTEKMQKYYFLDAYSRQISFHSDLCLEYSYEICIFVSAYNDRYWSRPILKTILMKAKRRIL